VVSQWRMRQASTGCNSRGNIAVRKTLRLLLVEDDPTISRFLPKGLREDQCRRPGW
jgi:hypothetical protein